MDTNAADTPTQRQPENGAAPGSAPAEGNAGAAPTAAKPMESVGSPTPAGPQGTTTPPAVTTVSVPAGATGTTAAAAVIVRGPVGVSRGVGCSALILPVAAVIGALACFFDGITSKAEGCSSLGSAACSSSLGWFGVALPLLISPILAAGTAIGSVAVRRHRATWLAVGYSIVFVSVIVGLAAASTGSQ